MAYEQIGKKMLNLDNYQRKHEGNSETCFSDFKKIDFMLLRVEEAGLPTNRSCK